jgi:TPR repeat protein
LIHSIVAMSAAKRAAQHKAGADGGDAEAQYQYGRCLRDGTGVARDLCGAALYFRLAADQGHAKSQLEFGLCLLEGLGIAQDFVRAAITQQTNV